MVVGLLSLVGGVWELYKVEVSLVPNLLIAVGGAARVVLWPWPSDEAADPLRYLGQ